MNKKNVLHRIVSTALILCFCLTSIFLFTPQTAEADAPQVELYYAKTVTYSTTYDQYFYIEGNIAIENIAYEKIVNLHYSQDGGAWQDVSATYLRTAPDGKEVWHFATTPVKGRTNGLPDPYSIHWNFAIQYQVNGNTYWDNNGGNDYYLCYSTDSSSCVPYILQKSALILNNSYRGTRGYFHGSIILKNLAYVKDVAMRYTTDNWATYTEVSAEYTNSMPNNLEKWTYFEWQGFPSAVIPEFVIRYTVNGVTYWDNNFGINYDLDYQ